MQRIRNQNGIRKPEDSGLVSTYTLLKEDNSDSIIPSQILSVESDGKGFFGHGEIWNENDENENNENYLLQIL